MSRASALLSVVNCSRRRGLVSPLGCPADLGLSRTARPASGEGKPASPSEGRCGRRAPQRSAEKTRGRAGSPTRATFYMASYLNIENCYPALP